MFDDKPYARRVTTPTVGNELGCPMFRPMFRPIKHHNALEYTMPNFNQTWPNFKSTGREATIRHIILRILTDRRDERFYIRGFIVEDSLRNKRNGKEMVKEFAKSEERVRLLLSVIEVGDSGAGGDGGGGDGGGGDGSR
ncbi:hypothetical protein M0802_004571 [Mischocyttarus mexicanus]|nr:hypothetical protein M0802_004571 [Mischocyttarus mexicanus]